MCGKQTQKDKDSIFLHNEGDGQMSKNVFWKCIAVIFLLAGFTYAESTITHPFVGVTRYQRTETSPRLLNINVLEIDLNAAGISFYVTPSNGDYVSGETNFQTTQNFMEQSDAQMAVNANFFAYHTGGGGGCVWLGLFKRLDCLDARLKLAGR